MTQLYANIERVVFQLKLALLLLVCILMILVKAGGKWAPNPVTEVRIRLTFVVGSLEGPQQEASTNSTPPILNTRTETGKYVFFRSVYLPSIHPPSGCQAGLQLNCFLRWQAAWPSLNESRCPMILANFSGPLQVTVRMRLFHSSDSTVSMDHRI
jgi:hypothetical protein